MTAATTTTTTTTTTRTRDAGRPRGARRAALYSRDGGRCIYCGGPAQSLDHLETFLAGGSWDSENVVTCCSRCNSRRGARELASWIRQLASERTHGLEKRAWRAEVSRIHGRIRAAVRRPVN